MAKFSFLGEVVRSALFMSVILWMETSSVPISSTVTEETTTINGKVSNACDNITCPLRKNCVLNAENRPECVCPKYCFLLYTPVCGSDGNTYSNRCELGVAACKTNSNITIIHQGKCNDKSSCKKITCSSGKRCVLNENYRSECVCASFCPGIIHRVCGSDNQTYDSDCELQREACQTNTNIMVLHHGSCEDGGSRFCDGITCPSGKSCEVNSDGQPECICNRACTKEYAPVCGNDGNTYSNRCILRAAACEANKNITVAKEGECKTDSACDEITCPPGKSCEANSEGQMECVCNTVCTDDYAPVCGSDGKTYDNRCELGVAACQANKTITVDYDGRCKADR